jgi:hypothetical protein
MPAHKNCSTYVSSSFTTANVRVCFNSNCAFVSLSLASLNNKPMFLPFTFVTCAELQKVRPMMPLLPAASYHRVHTFPYLTYGITSTYVLFKDLHTAIALGKPVTQEEGGPFGVDFTKVYTTRSSTTSSEITPENKCDHIHLFATLQ